MQRNSERVLDEYLVTAARAGDGAALSRLVQRWQPRLLRHAWRVLGDAEQARDMVQESWLQIIRGLWRLDDVVAFPAWAYRIVTRRCQRALLGTRHDHDSSEALAIAAAPGAECAGESAAEIGNVLAAMRSLPAPQRAALALFYLDELSVAEIAIALDISPGTVKTRLMHARRKLRVQLEGASNEQL